MPPNDTSMLMAGHLDLMALQSYTYLTSSRTYHLLIVSRDEINFSETGLIYRNRGHLISPTAAWPQTGAALHGQWLIMESEN
jgi:hypothetical protein